MRLQPDQRLTSDHDAAPVVRADESLSLDEQVRALVDLILAMAAGPLASLDLGGATVASKARGDVRVIAEVRRRVNRLVLVRPGGLTKQASELVRHALATGDWDWDAYGSTDSPPQPP